MKASKKRLLWVLILLSAILTSYVFWLSQRPVEIFAVHQDGEFSDVLVRTFPLTDKGKIAWWLKNKDMLKNKYNIPNPGPDGFFSINFWLFGNGYKTEGKYDRRCFEDMKTQENCIDKNKTFSVNKSRNMGVSFTGDSGVYFINDASEIIKRSSD